MNCPITLRLSLAARRSDKLRIADLCQLLNSVKITSVPYFAPLTSSNIPSKTGPLDKVDTEQSVCVNQNKSYSNIDDWNVQLSIYLIITAWAMKQVTHWQCSCCTSAASRCTGWIRFHAAQAQFPDERKKEFRAQNFTLGLPGRQKKNMSDCQNEEGLWRNHPHWWPSAIGFEKSLQHAPVLFYVCICTCFFLWHLSLMNVVIFFFCVPALLQGLWSPTFPRGNVHN